jgi:anti-sigma factor RsiW
MICRDIGKWLAQQAGEELSSREQAELQTHLAGCPECRRQAEIFQRSLGDLTQAFTGLRPLDLSGRIVHLAAGIPAVRSLGRWLLTAAELALVALMALWPTMAF